MATAWFEENEISNFGKNNKYNENINGLVMGVSPSTDLIEIINLFKDLFEFKHIGLYRFSPTEAYFEVSESDYFSFENGLKIFPDLQIKVHNKIAECYEIILPNRHLEDFMNEARILCGANRISEKILKCNQLQKSIIESYLCSPNNKFESSGTLFKRIRETDFFSLDSGKHNDIKKLKIENRHDIFDNLDFTETIEKLNLDTNLNSNIQLRFECHHKLYSNLSHFDIVLTENDLTNVEADCILSPVHINSSNRISDVIRIKAGNFYKTELKKKIDDYVKSKNDYVKSKNDSKKVIEKSFNTKLLSFLKILLKFKIFHLSSGEMSSTTKQILHSICPTKWNCDTIKETYFQIYNMYLKLFDYANELGAKSLAITFLGIQDEFEFGMVALYEALNDCLSKKNGSVDFKLSKILIVSLDKEALIVFKDYLENGYDKSVLELVFTDENEKESNLLDEQTNSEKLFIRKDEKISDLLNDQLETLDEKICSICKSRDFLITKSNTISLKYFKECRESKIKLYGKDSPRKCASCSIIYELTQIYFNHFDKKEGEKIICLKCCIQTFVNSLKKLYCSCCLRDIQKPSLNNFCSLHNVCNKCNITLKFAPNCYFCFFYEFYEKLTIKSNTPSYTLFNNHHKINCARDFCNLEFDENNSKIIKLAACGHAACKKNDSNNLCSFCSIFKIFEMMKNHHGIKVTKLDHAKIEEDVTKSRETMNNKAFQSYYKNMQNEIKDIQTKNTTLPNKNRLLDDMDKDEKKEYLTDDNYESNDSYDETDDRDDKNSQNEDEFDENHVDYKNDDNPKNSDHERYSQIKMIEKNYSSKNFLEGGVIEIKHLNENLPGFEDVNTIQIGFFLPNGIQKECHPKPNRHYHGIMVRYFFPNNKKGNDLVKKLEKLFQSGELFSIGPSKSNKDEYIVQTEFELKTSKSGGLENNGYPDEGYLERLSAKLASLIS